MGLGCLWHRASLEPYADGVLTGRRAAWLSGHLGRCRSCRDAIEGARRLRRMVGSATSPVEPPDWSGFWLAVESRIRSEAPRPLREAWWLPVWKPIWGHPRVALAGTLAASVLVAWSLWPVREGDVPVAWAGPVTVQDVATSDPGGSVMVYASPGQPTVIWVFGSDAASGPVSR
jgi:hypothetical protein